MDEGFASSKEAWRKGLVERVLWSFRLVVPPRCMYIAITENRSGMETSRVIKSIPCPKAQLTILAPLQGCNPGSGQHRIV